MGQSPQGALLISVALVAAASFLMAGILKWRHIGSPWSELLLPAIFLAAYYLVYNKVPAFPPVGAVNKIFYVAVLGTVVGVAVDLLKLPKLSRAIVLLQPVAAAFYIGWVRLTDGPIEVIVAAAAGLLVMLLLSRDQNGEAGEANLRRAIVLGIFCLGFAPLALFGASSSSFQLLIIFAVAIFASLVWNVANAQYAFATTAMLGGAGSILAVVLAVTLITRKTDLAILCLFGAVFLAPLASSRFARVFPAKGQAARLAIFTVLCLVPAASAVAVAIIRYGASFPV
ncbi:hypothetical protein [Mesorhizobium onobrychidis]|uniref:DMT family transporter n=1 Tax=Mesorhizobium onobrychidis TaxID=2775404 RepID=A0ABY5QX57_9HYPH|nr:hypothetical protein [Mesorhizobium onobrychidis]UVC15047.1 hypothetical protein IHQ72_31405 [Mesorhizobium onobrychidis]